MKDMRPLDHFYISFIFSAKRFSASFAGNSPLYVPPSISEQPEGNMKTEQNQSKINQDMTGNCQR